MSGTTNERSSDSGASWSESEPGTAAAAAAAAEIFATPDFRQTAPDDAQANEGAEKSRDPTSWRQDAKAGDDDDGGASGGGGARKKATASKKEPPKIGGRAAAAVDDRAATAPSAPGAESSWAPPPPPPPYAAVLDSTSEQFAADGARKATSRRARRNKGRGRRIEEAEALLPSLPAAADLGDVLPPVSFASSVPAEDASPPPAPDPAALRDRSRAELALGWTLRTWHSIIDRTEVVERRITTALQHVWHPAMRVWTFLMRSPLLLWLTRQFAAYVRWMCTGTDWSSYVAWICALSFGYTRTLYTLVAEFYGGLRRVWRTYTVVLGAVLLSFVIVNALRDHAHHNARLWGADTALAVRAVDLLWNASRGSLLAVGLPAYMPVSLVVLTLLHSVDVAKWAGGWAATTAVVIWRVTRFLAAGLIDTIGPECAYAGDYIVRRIIVPLCKVAPAILYWGAAGMAAACTAFAATLSLALSAVWLPVSALGRSAFFVLELVRSWSAPWMPASDAS